MFPFPSFAHNRVQTHLILSLHSRKQTRNLRLSRSLCLSTRMSPRRRSCAMPRTMLRASFVNTASTIRCGWTSSKPRWLPRRTSRKQAHGTSSLLRNSVLSRRWSICLWRGPSLLYLTGIGYLGSGRHTRRAGFAGEDSQ